MLPANKQLIQSGSDFFEDLVITSLHSRDIAVSVSVIKYLSNMLSFYVDAKNLHEPEFDESGKKNPRTLAELWLTAQTSEPFTQRELLRKLGDRTLYISGFFAESLNRSLVDVDYYCSMGSGAYHSLGTMAESGSKDTFFEMSDRFLDLVEVFNVISHETFKGTNQGILRLYETYLRTGSNLAKERLEEVGVFVSAEATLKKASGH